MSFASVYPLYIAKVERKGRTKSEVDQIIHWLMGYSKKELDKNIVNETNFETFISECPSFNPARKLIKGVICGI